LAISAKFKEVIKNQLEILRIFFLGRSRFPLEIRGTVSGEIQGNRGKNGDFTVGGEYLALFGITRGLRSEMVFGGSR
jgi:hypothetical protein